MKEVEEKKIESVWNQITMIRDKRHVERKIDFNYKLLPLLFWWIHGERAFSIKSYSHFVYRSHVLFLLFYCHFNNFIRLKMDFLKRRIDQVSRWFFVSLNKEFHRFAEAMCIVSLECIYVCLGIIHTSKCGLKKSLPFFLFDATK